MFLLFTKFTLLFACIILFLHSAQAFCVYNFVDDRTTAIKIYNLDKKSNSFNILLKPGENACCHWSNRACNPGGQRESIVYFKVESRFKWGVANPSPLVYCEAGGSLAFRGSSFDDFRLLCTQTDGTEVFSYLKEMPEL